MTGSNPFSWYAGKRVFLTGHTGFKGAWLTLWLKKLGADVFGFALAPETGGLFETANVAAGMTSTIGDVRDRPALAAALKDAAPDIVFHMAAQSLVRRSYEEPVETFETNVVGTANLLESARSVSSVRAIVVVTSDKCYENQDSSVAFTEDMPMGGHDPYSASKGCTELVAAAFARSFYHKGACTLTRGRAGNVIGGGDWAEDRIIPDLMRAAKQSAPIMIRRPDAVRPWQHVLEPLRGYLMLGERAVVAGRDFAGAWNFGPKLEDAVPVRAIVEQAQRLWPQVTAEFADVVAGPHEASMLRLDCSKAKKGLGWTPLLDLNQALELTIEWYREVQQAPASSAAIVERQISAYQQLAVAIIGEV